jgi:PEP-CTERM/exosortase A-associated glycosyltransferase
MSPTRILHILDHSLPIGSGYSYRSRSILLAQRGRGLNPAVVTSPKQGAGPDGCEVLDGISHYRTGGSGAGVPIVHELNLMRRMAARIARVARTEGTEVIHAHSPVLNGLPALWAGRRLGIRTVYEVRTFWEDAAVSHGTHVEASLRYRASRSLETLVLRRVDAVVAICEGIRAEVIGRGVSPKRVTVVPNGVSSEWFEPRPRATGLAERLGLAEGPVLGYIGSFSHYEGLPFLIDAMPEIARRIPGVKLVLAGSGRDEAAVQAAARRAGSSVVMLGRISQTQVRDLYTLLTALVLPRQRMRLTELVTPLKPLEAMAAGIPVLASDVGGHAELVDDGRTGLLFKAESRESLVEQAVRIVGDGRLRTHVIETATRWVREERTWDRTTAGYVSAYQEAK